MLNAGQFEVVNSENYDLESFWPILAYFFQSTLHKFYKSIRWNKLLNLSNLKSYFYSRSIITPAQLSKQPPNAYTNVKKSRHIKLSLHQKTLCFTFISYFLIFYPSLVVVWFKATSNARHQEVPWKKVC